MPNYTFKPDASKIIVNWADPAVWREGVVPNRPDADVDFAVVYYAGTNSPYTSIVQISSDAAFDTRSVDLRDYLTIYGSLHVGGTIHQYEGGGTLEVGGNGKLTGGTLIADGQVQGSGTLAFGTIVNNVFLIGGGSLSVSADHFSGAGILAAGSGRTSIAVTAGGFANMSGGTLTGGGLKALQGGTLALDVGGIIAATAARIELSGGTITSRDPSTGTDVALTTSLHSITSTGELYIDGGSYTFGSLNVAGTLTMASGRVASTALTILAGGQLHGGGTIMSAVRNEGVIRGGEVPSAGVLVLNGSITGGGMLAVGPGFYNTNGRQSYTYRPTLEINGATSQNVIFDNEYGILKLDQPTSFTGAIGVKGYNDQIILSNVALGGITGMSYLGNADGGTLTLQQAGGALSVKFLGAYSVASFILTAGPQVLSIDPPSVQLVASPNAAHALSDFNGDRHGDILWRNANGAVSEWQLTGDIRGDQARAGVFDAYADLSWRIVETPDWNGDGRSDILWRNTDGRISVWEAQAGGTFRQSAYNDGSVGNAWAIAAAGDTNGDGKDDILWRNQDGSISVWTSSGAGFQQNSYFHGSVGTSWKVAGLADLNGDGRADIVWRNDNGALSTWLAGASGFRESAYNDRADPTWHIAALADFDGDGRGDILWRNDNGAVSMWRSNGSGFDQSVYNAMVATGWHVSTVGDFNNDGRADILWRNDDGRLSTWESTETSFVQNVYSNAVGTDWSIVGHQFPL